MGGIRRRGKESRLTHKLIAVVSMHRGADTKKHMGLLEIFLIPMHQSHETGSESIKFELLEAAGVSDMALQYNAPCLELFIVIAQRLDRVLKNTDHKVKRLGEIGDIQSLSAVQIQWDRGSEYSCGSGRMRQIVADQCSISLVMIVFLHKLHLCPERPASSPQEPLLQYVHAHKNDL